MSQEKRFLEEFEIPSYEDWKKAAEETLGGAPFEKKLITKTYEGIDLKPLYSLADIESLEYLVENMPGEYAYTRGKSRIGYKKHAWEISQEINYPQPELFNTAARKDLNCGQTALNISINEEFAAKNINSNKECLSNGSLLVSDLNDLEKAFSGININEVPVCFKPNTLGFELAALFAAYCKNNKIDLNSIKVNFGLNPLNELIKNGKSGVAPAKLLDDAALLINWAKENAANANVISVDAEVYHNGGSNSIQELAFALSTGVYLINELMRRGLEIDEIATRIVFNFSIGARFFTEIAKFRAARLLWARIIKEFGGNEESQKMTLMARTSKVNKTKFDPFVNMLRGTSEAMAGVLAGVDALHVGTFDETLGLPSDFSRRIARNIQSIILNESHLTDTIDPAGGSWYLETLTNEIAQKVWDLFRKVESKGGILNALIEGFPQAEINAIKSQRVSNLAGRRESLLGTNKYPNLTEKPVENLTIFAANEADKYVNDYSSRLNNRNNAEIETKVKEFNKYFSSDRSKSMEAAINAVAAGATIAELLNASSIHNDNISIEPIKEFRSGEIFEEMRLAATEYKAKTGKLPQVCLVNFGALKEFKGRNDFSSDFFSVGGFEIVSSEGFNDAASAMTYVGTTDYSIYVVCSTDDRYPNVVPEFASALKQSKPKAKLVLAGLPTDYVEQFKSAGVDEFIHIKANIYELLSSLLKEIGVL